MKTSAIREARSEVFVNASMSGSAIRGIDDPDLVGHDDMPGREMRKIERYEADDITSVLGNTPKIIEGAQFAEPNPRPMFPNPPGKLRLEPYSETLRDRIWWGSSSLATARWAAGLGMNLQSSTLKNDENGKPFHVQQREQIEAYREAWKEAGHEREPRVSVSRSIFALVNDEDRRYFGLDRQTKDQIGNIDEQTRAIFGRSYAAEPDVLVEELAEDEAIQAADTLLLTVPNQLGVDYNTHALESILTHVAPGLDWR